MNVTRRSFIKGLGSLAAFSVAIDAAPVMAQMGFAKLSKGTGGRGNDEVLKSVCVHCVNFCAIEVRKVGGVIKSIGPDPARRDIYNHGICPKGVAGGFNMYNPYRVKVPLKRTNPKKGLNQDPRWVEISWEEAFKTMTERLEKIKKDNPAKLIWQHGHGKYLIGDQFPKAFCKVFGTPNVIHRTTTCESARHVADDITWGYHGFLPDIDHCNLFVVFGSNYFEAEQYARWMDHSVTRAKERGMKVIVVEPRLSAPAAKADQWIPIRPGKDVAMVMAMTKLLIDAKIYDEPFLITYTNAPQLVGADGKVLRDKEGQPLVWDTASKSAKPYVEGVTPALRGSYKVGGATVNTAFDVYAESLKKMTPEAAAEICGVPAQTIRDLAMLIGKEARIGTTTRIGDFSHRYRPVSLHTWRGMTAKEYGVQTWRSALMLQMVLGIPDAIGGHKLGKVLDHPEYMEVAKCEYPPKRVDLAKSVYFPNGHHDVCQQVALTVLDPKAYGLKYEPEMQIFYATNRPMSTSDTKVQFRSMEKTFNVCIEVHMTETAWMSDIVLPDLGYLESWHMAPTRAGPHAKHTGIRQPIVNAYNIPHDGYSILWELSKRLGLRDAYATALNDSWKLKDSKFATGRDYTAREAVEILWADKTGKPFSVALKEGFVGGAIPPKDVYTKGIEGKMKGPGKPKMQFYADSMVQTFDKLKKTVEKEGIKNIDLAQYKIAYSPFPLREHAFPTPHREAEKFPFYLMTYKRIFRNQAGASNTNPILNFALGKDTQENAIVINTSAGEKLGLKDGDRVTLETRIGKVSGKCQLTEGIRPDTVGVSYHYGHVIEGYPAYARKGIDINQVLELHPDKISGMNSFNDTKCKITKA